MAAQERAPQWERIIEWQGLSRKDLLVIGIFNRGHREISLVRAVYDFLRGRGPAAVVRGRAGQDTLRHAAWQPRIAVACAEEAGTRERAVIWTEIVPGASTPTTPIPLAARR